MTATLWRAISVLLAGALTVLGEPAPEGEPAGAPAKEGAKAEADWTSLVPKEGMGQWEVIQFAGIGEILWKDGVLLIEEGAEVSGVVWKGELPKVPYEIELEARRMSGTDFFCGMTLPVREKTSVTLVVGGWGGGVVGISSIDGMDASENETTDYMGFDDKKWYKIRMRVRKNRLEVWIGEKQVAKVDTTNRKLGLRFGDIERCAPLGLATWQTRSELRKVRWKAVPELKAEK